jgi:type I restriction enzyme S subunit
MISMTISRSRLTRWDVKYQATPSWDPRLKPSLKKVSQILERREEDAASGDPLGSISFNGIVKLRTNTRGSKGRMRRAYSNDVVFSRIDIRNGAVGVVSDGLPALAFSNEYPVFSIRNGANVRPEYMRLLCRTQVFRDQVNAQVVGHSGRRRLSAAEFEELMVPVPSLEQQDRVLQELASRRLEARNLRRRGLPLITEAGAEMLRQLRVQVPDFEVLQAPFEVKRSSLLRWSVRKAMAAKQGTVQELNCPDGFQLLGSSELASVAYGVTKNPGNRPGQNARPYLRVANVQDAFLDLREVKYIDVPDSAFESVRLQDGDLLLCEGNSRELVGRPALWRGEIDDCVHQNHVLRVRVNQAMLLPEYVLAYMHGPAGRWYFDDCAKQTTNLATINSTDLKLMPIPVPTIERQEELAGVVKDARTEAERLRSKAASLDEGTDVWLATQIGSATAPITEPDDEEHVGGE